MSMCFQQVACGSVQLLEATPWSFPKWTVCGWECLLFVFEMRNGETCKFRNNYFWSLIPPVGTWVTMFVCIEYQGGNRQSIEHSYQRLPSNDCSLVGIRIFTAPFSPQTSLTWDLLVRVGLGFFWRRSTVFPTWWTVEQTNTIPLSFHLPTRVP